MLKVRAGHLLELHTNEQDGALTLVFATDSLELHPGHFLKGNPGGFSIAIFNSDRAVLTEDATPADIAAAAQGVVKGSQR